MQRDDAIARLKATEADLRALGVGGLYLFGSLARDEADPASDVDVFVDPATPDFYALSNFMGTYARLRAAFPERAVGYGTRTGLSPHIRPAVEHAAIRIF